MFCLCLNLFLGRSALCLFVCLFSLGEKKLNTQSIYDWTTWEKHEHLMCLLIYYIYFHLFSCCCCLQTQGSNQSMNQSWQMRYFNLSITNHLLSVVNNAEVFFWGFRAKKNFKKKNRFFFVDLKIVLWLFLFSSLLFSEGFSLFLIFFIKITIIIIWVWGKRKEMRSLYFKESRKINV
jgi:hypothetical protein